MCVKIQISRSACDLEETFLEDPTDSTAREPAPWWNSEEVCILSDEERHLGHAIQFHDRWYAFDATRRNAEGTDFAFIGAFATAEIARRNVERVAEGEREQRASAKDLAARQTPESWCDALWAMALLVQSAVVYGEWALARRRIRKLLAMSQEALKSTDAIEYTVRDLGRAVVRHDAGEIEQALTKFEQELARARAKAATA
jgi:hypothetical protein